MTMMIDRSGSGQKATQISIGVFLLLSAVSSLVVVAARTRKIQHRSIADDTSQLDNNNNNDDADYLKRAHQIRLTLQKPQHSHFRVVALLLMDDGSVIVGANDEPSPTLQGSLCAERGAFMRLRVEESTKGTLRKVQTVYIVSDANQPVPPGTLCREYMMGHPACSPLTRVVLQSAQLPAKEAPWIVTLADLYPYPSIYMGLQVQDQVQMAKAYASEHVGDHASLVNVHMTPNELDRLCQAAVQATQHDNHDTLHAMRYGAAVALLVVDNDNDNNDSNSEGRIEIVSASQRKAVEYGASLDAVCQLAPSLFKSNGTRHIVLALCFADQFGNEHAPFAAARSFLVEHGFEDCYCILKARASDGALYRKAVTANELAPFVPHFK